VNCKALSAIYSGLNAVITEFNSNALLHSFSQRFRISVSVD